MRPEIKTLLPLLFVSTQVFAQSLPDASVRYPEARPRLAPPASSGSFMLQGAPLCAPGAQNGEQFILQGIRFQGNTVFSAEQLGQLVAPLVGAQVGLAELQEAANRISSYYREAGYPFARVYLPAQDVADGVVTMEVAEGRFGAITATVERGGEKRPSPVGQAYLASLKSGAVIAGADVERIALILNDLPGYTAVPIVRPGAEVGTGDLEMRLVENDPLQVAVGIDNHGSRFTGSNRVRVDVARARNFVFGDELRFTGLLTDGETSMGYVGYGLPLMSNGLRLDVSALYSGYELSGDWMTGAGFKGRATIAGAQLSYPWFRSQSLNLSFFGGLQHKRYVNRIGFHEQYNVNALPLGMNFTVRDALNGGGITYGTVTVQAARVSSDNVVNAAREREFAKLNLDIARIQRLTDNLQASLKMAGQFTEDGIDSTEFIAIAGPNAVRAYPVGEFSGHRGWTAQLELAYSLPQHHLSPYLFYDHGHAVNDTTEQSRELSGYGAGVRYEHAGWTLELAAAWHQKGGASQVEPDEHGVRVWAMASKRF